MVMTPIERVLGRLEKPRQRQPGQWSARCPAHADKGPSLSIRETSDGVVLLHCFAGCLPYEVTEAMGLDLPDLFPERDRRPATAPKKLARLLTAGQALELLDAESNLVAVVAGNIGYGSAITSEDRQRVITAAARIAYLRQEVMA
ncbi:hypothetical protein JI739_07765 [Ramlibacter sp. AW1]|uniref:Virulence-associated protein E n=1 Tax=Ramlibacter aurantiacus TaxID=2801330 RepID=A0A936ZG03_9BURK|nr:hypothetical protein [Ramlibacter aurantiacus]MBL0420237.1 hypothetical protein [Ramlibacter aurantiacus]